MPRGKRTVFAMFCGATNGRIGTIRLHKQNSKGIGWKDMKLKKFSPFTRKREDVKLKEEKHSS